MSWMRRLGVGVVTVALVVTAGVAATSAPAGATALVFTVNSLGDTGDAHLGDGVCATATSTCTLRAAVEEAVSVPSNTYTIHFSVAGKIPLGSSLDQLTAPMVIDASTAPGYTVAGGPVVTLVGGAVSGGINCLTPNADNITIRALRLADCTVGIAQYGGAHLRVVGNQIGTNGVAFDAASAVGAAMNLTADDAQVGGTTAADRNVISGFLFKGIRIQQSATHAVVEGNYIGTDAAGTTAVRNPDGTNIFNAARTADLGSGTSGGARGASTTPAAPSASASSVASAPSTPAGTKQPNATPTGTPNAAVETASPSATITGNVIAGNPGYGVLTYTAGAFATITGNRVGVGADGTTPLYNVGVGISVQEAATATIGGTAADAGNQVDTTRQVSPYFAQGAGIWVSGATATIQGNTIGTDAAGHAGLGNLVGISVNSTLTTDASKLPATATVGGTAAGAGNVVAGNVDGVTVDGSTGATPSSVSITGNTIGVGPGGSARPNTFGVVVGTRAATTVGGTTAAAGNLISGNTGTGVTVTDDQSGVTILGNHIGTNAAGTAAIANVGDGVAIAPKVGATNPGATVAVIGGTVAGSGNVISGNGGDGIDASGPVLIEGNRIGTNGAGTAAMGNASAGIRVSAGAPTIGGAAAGAGNLISGNGFNGISSAGGDGFHVSGNTIGLNVAKTAVLPNAYAQIFGGNRSVIGGVGAGEANTISSGNTREGVQLYGTGNVVRGNLIYGTGGLSIDLYQHNGTNGVGSSNGDQVPPTLTSTTIGSSSTTVAGTVTSAHAGPILVDVYASNACQAHYGSGEARQFLGTISVPYAGGGVTTAFSGTVAKATVGSIVTATSTAPVLGTSQLSTCQPTSDLAVTEQHNFDQTVVGADVGSQFTVTNNGPTSSAATTLAFTGLYGSEWANDVATADTPSKGTVTIDPTGATGTWSVPALASGASASVCLRADVVRSTYVLHDPSAGDFTVPAAFGPQLDTNAAPGILDPFTGNNLVETYIPVTTTGTATVGAAVCPLPSTAVDASSVVRPGSGTTPMTFAVTLSKAQTRPVTFHYATQNGTAVAVADYVATGGDVTIPAGQTTATITVQAVGSQSDEPDKSFRLLLTAPHHTTLAATTVTGTVRANHLLGGCPPGSTSVQRFVCHLYFDALGRSPDSGGFSYWVKKLGSGTPRSTMAKSYLTQPESLRKVADRAYVLYLARHGTNAELSAWATKLAKHTVTTQDIRISVLASAEYYAKTGGTNTTYVQQMFQDVFRRPVDSSGLTYWTGQLAAGKSRTNVATRFMAEPEGRRKIVGDIYLRFLRRDPTTSEANGWVTQLSKGKTEVDVGIALVASTEYFDRPQG